jgi:hypothetical protein
VGEQTITRPALDQFLDSSSFSNCAKKAHFAFSGFQFLIVPEFPLSIGTIIYSHRRSHRTSEKQKNKIEIKRNDRVRWDTRLLRGDPATIVNSIPTSATVTSALCTGAGRQAGDDTPDIGDRDSDSLLTSPESGSLWNSERVRERLSH